MRVLLTVGGCSPGAGTARRYTRWLAGALATRHDVVVVAPADAADRDGSVVGTAVSLDGASGVELRRLPATDGWRDDTGAPSGLERDPFAEDLEEAFADVLASVDPDVVHLQGLAGLSATLPQRCRARDVPVVLTPHDAWPICHRGHLLRPDGQQCCGPTSVEKCTACYADGLERTAWRRTEDVEGRRDDAAPSSPSVLDGAAEQSGQGTRAAALEDLDLRLVGDDERGLEDLGTTVTRRSERLHDALETLDLVLAPSRFLARQYADAGVPEEHLVHCRPGVPLAAYTDAESSGASDTLTVCYTGPLTPDDGVQVLVDAFRCLDGDATLQLFGSFDPSNDDFHAQLRDAAAGERITFHGPRPADVAPFEVADVVVAPSLYPDGDPLAIQEAFAAAVPVVTTEDGAASELVAHRRDGLTCQAGDPVALADHLQSLVDEPQLLERLRAGVREPTSLADHVRHVAFLYDVCATGRAPASVDGVDPQS